VNVPASDSQTHNLLMSIRDELRKTNALLTLQLKGESTLMTEIESAFQELTDRVTNIGDVVTANSAAIDGAVSILASGVAEIKDLASRIGTVADDPDMVRTLTAKLRAASDTLTAKQAALTAASAELAAAVVANTPHDTTGGDSGNGDTGPSTEASTTSAGTGTGVTSSNISSGLSTGDTALDALAGGDTGGDTSAESSSSGDTSDTSGAGSTAGLSFDTKDS